MGLQQTHCRRRRRCSGGYAPPPPSAPTCHPITPPEHPCPPAPPKQPCTICNPDKVASILNLIHQITPKNMEGVLWWSSFGRATQNGFGGSSGSGGGPNCSGCDAGCSQNIYDPSDPSDPTPDLPRGLFINKEASDGDCNALFRDGAVYNPWDIKGADKGTTGVYKLSQLAGPQGYGGAKRFGQDSETGSSCSCPDNGKTQDPCCNCLQLNQGLLDMFGCNVEADGCCYSVNLYYIVTALISAGFCIRDVILNDLGLDLQHTETPDLVKAFTTSRQIYTIYCYSVCTCECRIWNCLIKNFSK